MVLDKMKDILVEQLECNPEDITMESLLVDDLGADSLDAIDIVMIGRSAYCSCISRVAASNVSTSLVLCGISAILGISASKDCILRRRAMWVSTVRRLSVSGMPPQTRSYITSR